MRFVGIRDFRNKSGEIWKRLGQEKEIVITSNGKPMAILSLINETNLEESLNLLRHVRATVAVEALQQRSVKSGLNQMSLEDINAEIHKARKARTK